MPEHIVLSPYSFVGFEICNKLMEDGLEVIGINLPAMIDPIEKEEKELFLGRNANFKIRSPDQIINEVKKDYFFYISDMNMGCKDWHKYVDTFPKKNEDTFIYILMKEDWMDNFFIPSRINTTIMMPTIYGPWQPLDSVFSKCLRKGTFPFEQYELEKTTDALYISDAIEAILNISQLDRGIYQVQSDIQEHGHLLLKELGYQIIVDHQVRRDSVAEIQSAKKYLAKTKISPREGIDLVKKHIKMMGLMR